MVQVLWFILGSVLPTFVVLLPPRSLDSCELESRKCESSSVSFLFFIVPCFVSLSECYHGGVDWPGCVRLCCTAVIHRAHSHPPRSRLHPSVAARPGVLSAAPCAAQRDLVHPWTTCFASAEPKPPAPPPPQGCSLCLGVFLSCRSSLLSCSRAHTRVRLWRLSFSS